MYFMALCVNNQALRDVDVDLSQPGPLATRRIDVPMAEVYNLELWRRPLAAGKPFDPSVDFACSRAETPLTLTLLVSRAGETKVESRTFVASCPGPHGGNPAFIRLGQWRLAKGRYDVVVRNDQPLPPVGPVHVLLVGVGVEAR